MEKILNDLKQTTKELRKTLKMIKDDIDDMKFRIGEVENEQYKEKTRTVLLTPKQASLILDVDIQTIRRYRQKGYIKFKETAPHKFRYYKDDLLKYNKKQKRD